MTQTRADCSARAAAGGTTTISASQADNAVLLGAVERNLASPTPVRAKDVAVVKLFRASCLRDGCGWRGADHGTYQDANAERQAHLNQHILAEG